MKILNIDWLEVYCHEPAEQELSADYFEEQGNKVTRRLYGTPIYAEMFTIAKQIAASQTSFMPFVVAAVFYYIFNLVVAMVMEWIEKRLGYYQ